MRREGTERRVRFSTVDRQRRATTFPRRAQGWRLVGVATAIGLVGWLGGCAATQKTVGGWFGAGTPTPAPRATPAAAAARVYYAGIEGLPVHSEPSASAKVIGQLSLHEKVTRYKLERGYAYVESAKSSTKGWVKNAQLIWRLPTAPTTAAPGREEPEEPEAEEPAAPAVEEPEEPVAPAATATVAAPLPTPTSTTAVPAPPGGKETPGGVVPSIFDPY